MQFRTFSLAALLAILALAAAAPPALADEPTQVEIQRAIDETGRRPAGAAGPEEDGLARYLRKPVSLGVESAWIHQFETSVDSGSGSFSADRLLARATVAIRLTSKIPLLLSFGYRLDSYEFEGGGSPTFPGRPWSRIHSPRFTLPMAAPLGKRWLLIGGLTVRSTAEEGARVEDGVTGGAFLGASYEASERLSIGPGFGVLTEIEDGLSFFPVVVVDWKIRPNLSLKTGGGLGATQGPGLFFEWRKSSCWTFSAGGRYERLRFRLDEQGVAPGGVGEESSYALVAFARYAPSRKLRFSATLGANFGGELHLEDRTGNRLFRESYGSAVMAGIGLSFDL